MGVLLKDPFHLSGILLGIGDALFPEKPHGGKDLDRKVLCGLFLLGCSYLLDNPPEFIILPCKKDKVIEDYDDSFLIEEGLYECFIVSLLLFLPFEEPFP
jgi:hypothetical protein